MRYTVVWDPRARQELARIWARAPDQQAVADAANAIDKRLRYSPETAGDDINGYRRLIVPPLAVLFVIRPDDCQVEVLQVWRW